MMVIEYWVETKIKRMVVKRVERYNAEMINLCWPEGGSLLIETEDLIKIEEVE